MSLESFYGGKQGISPVIKHAFKYVDTNDNAYLAAIAAGATAAELKSYTMDACFAESTYENVWYGELCIIDTTNKNNPNNGKLFRRTLKGKGDIELPNRSAEYIGQIVGPSSGVPFFSLGNLQDTNDRAHEDYVVNDDTEVAYTTDGVEMRHNKLEQDVDLHTFNTGAKQMQVPGKYISGYDEDDNPIYVYNDTIKYNWFNIRNNTKESPLESWMYLGFEIPYPSLDIDITNQDWKRDIVIEKTDETEEHPFYHHWRIDIPRGVRGNAASNIRFATYADFRNTSTHAVEFGMPYLYSFSDVEMPIAGREVFSVPSEPDIPEPLKPKDGQTLADLQDVPFFVYDYTFYDKVYGEDVSIETYTFFLGLYKEVTSIKLNEDGSVVVKYSNATEVDIAKDNHLTWITSTDVNSDGLLTFNYNDGTEENYQLPYPASVQVTDRGLINVFFKDDTQIQIMGYDGNPFDINYVKYLLVDPSTKELSYKRHPDESVVDLGVAMNYVKAMTVDERFHLLVYYESSLYRPTPEDIQNLEKDGYPIEVQNQLGNWNIAIWHRPDGDIKYRSGVTIGGVEADEYWQDFGSVRQVNKGIKVTTQINYDDYQYADVVPSYTIDQFIEKVLNPRYWDDQETIENPYYAGRISSTLDEEGNDPLKGTFIYTTKVGNGTAYFYDYDAYTWVLAGSWGESSTIDIQIDGLNYEETTISQKGATLLPRENAGEKTTWTPIWNTISG